MSQQGAQQLPRLSHILETCLYVRSMDRAVTFYRDILKLTPTVSSPRLTMFPLGNTSLILFQLGATEKDNVSIDKDTGSSLTVAGHGPDRGVLDVLLGSDSESSDTVAQSLHAHFCLAAHSPDDVQAWEKYLASKDVKMRGVMKWGRGGRSVYFEDVDGNVGEIGSKGIWEHW